MSRLYDRIMRDYRKDRRTAPDTPWELLARATVVNADNVASYFLDYSYNDRWKLTEGMPTLAPPLETMFIEAGTSAGVLTTDFDASREYRVVERLYSWGVLCHSYTLKDDEVENNRILTSLGEFGEKCRPFVDKIGWVTQMWTFAEPERKKPAGPTMHLINALDISGDSILDGDGEILGGPVFRNHDTDSTGYGIPANIPTPEEFLKLPRSEQRALLPELEKKQAQMIEQQTRLTQEIAEIDTELRELHEQHDLAIAGLGSLNSLLLAIAFMHCKNVALLPIDPPLKPSLKNERRYGKPLTRYHVLQIEPMKTVLRVEGGIHEGGLKRALHICRGHFKEFGGDNKKLFGKYEGTYWWGPQARGSKRSGQVVKDYKVKL